MIPFLVLLICTLLLRCAGAAGVTMLESWAVCLRGGLAAMFLLTASAHWGKRRPDLIRMVPPGFSRPDLIVTVTGVLEILGAIGLLLPVVHRIAAPALALLLVAMFPANIRAAREHLTIAGQPVPALPVRSLLQLVFIAALAVAGLANF